MSVESWAEQVRLSNDRQDIESKRTIDILQSLLAGRLSPEEAARDITGIYEPLIRHNPSDLRTGFIWSIICNAVRALGGNQEINNRLVSLLGSISEIKAKDSSGNVMKHEWGGKYWTDLPTFSLVFREYGIAIEEDEGLEISEWLEQATPFLNATSFAATGLAKSSLMAGMSFYVPVCMREALESPQELEIQYRSVVFVAAATTWILIAGRTIYRLCQEENTSGFSPQKWELWKKGFGEVAVDEKIEKSMQERSLKAANEMEKIEKGE